MSWDEALDAIAARLQQISDEYGPESILPYSYAGTIGVLGYGSMDRRFFHRLGGEPAGPDHLLGGRRGGVEPGVREEAGHADGGFPAGEADRGLGREHPRQQRSPVADGGAGAAQRGAADRDRPLQDAHGGAGGLAYRDPAGHGCGAGAGHDARDSARGAGGSRVHCRDDARV